MALAAQQKERIVKVGRKKIRDGEKTVHLHVSLSESDYEALYAEALNELVTDSRYKKPSIARVARKMIQKYLRQSQRRSA